MPLTMAELWALPVMLRLSTWNISLKRSVASRTFRLRPYPLRAHCRVSCRTRRSSPLASSACARCRFRIGSFSFRASAASSARVKTLPVCAGWIRKRATTIAK